MFYCFNTGTLSHLKCTSEKQMKEAFATAWIVTAVNLIGINIISTIAYSNYTKILLTTKVTNEYLYKCF
jgi:hypothetical protein